MSKEVIRSTQFAAASPLPSDLTQLSDEQKQAIDALYEEHCAQLKQGQLVNGTVVRVSADGVLVDIRHKSDGLIPLYEFSPHELKGLKAGEEVEVMLDRIEDVEGNVILSYEKAKALKAWDKIIKLFEEGKPVEGVITHRVKGGFNVDIGIGAFLPGSQVDIQRVTDFDHYVGQTITAEIIKVNKRRGNVIVSRRKYLSELRAAARQKIMTTIEEGNVVQGVVKNITNYGAFVDIGGVDGLLHITDMTWGRIAHPTVLLKISDTITVKILSVDRENEKISLGMKQLESNPWEKVGEKLKIGDKIKGTISSITDYGLFVEVAKGVEGLVHISEISWTSRINDLKRRFSPGEEVEILVVSLDADNRRMSLSIKQLETNPWESIKEKFKVSDKIKGTISNITDFGIFVQLVPGIDGLVHISDLSWTEHIEHPSDMYQRSQEVEAVILSIDELSKKISLGIKQLDRDPWESIEQEYPIGKTVEGTVSKVASFGAFIKLPTGIEGLIHISEISDNEIEKVEDVLKVGDKHAFRVINVAKGERKLGLSLRTPRAAGEERRTRERIARPSRPRFAEQRIPAAPRTSVKSQLQLELERHMGATDKSDDKKGE